MSFEPSLLFCGLAAVGSAVVHFLWQGALIGLGAWALLATLPRDAASRRHAVGMGALMLALSAFLTTFALAFRGLWESWGTGAPAPSGLGQAGEQRASAWFAAPLVSERWLMAAAWAWFIGVGAMALRFALNGLWVLRFKRRGTRAPDASWVEAFESLKAQLGVKRGVRLLSSTLAEVPMVVGWISPVVLVPTAAFAGLAPEQLRALLIHELAHLKRHDQWLNALQAAVEILLFFHPVVWWISGQVRIEREACCDDSSVRVTGSARLMAEALVAMESLRATKPSFTTGSAGHAALASQTEDGGILMHRITRILGVGSQRSVSPGWQLPTGVLLAGAVALGGAQATPLGSEGQQDALVERVVTVPRARQAAGQVTGTVDAVIEAQSRKELELARLQEAYQQRAARLEQSVGSGEITKIEAQAALAELQVQMKLQAQHMELDRGVASGEVSADQARDRLAQLKKKLHVEGEAGRIKAALASGSMSREQAERALAELERRHAAERAQLSTRETLGRIERFREQKQAHGDVDAKVEWAAVQARVEAAVQAGRLSKAQAQQLYHDYKLRMAAKYDERRPPVGVSADQQRKVHAELEELVRTGRLSKEDMRAHLEALHARRLVEETRRADAPQPRRVLPEASRSEPLRTEVRGVYEERRLPEVPSAVKGAGQRR